MRYFEIIEARRNPLMNPKFSMLDALKKYAGKNAFVTFTDDVGSESHKWAGRSGPGGTNTSKNARGAKIGINPQYYYNTPLGIYAYPLDYALSKEGDVEFAGRRPYLWVFEPKGKVLDLATYTMNDLQKDCTRLRAKISVISVPHDIFHSAADSARVKTPGGMLWNITRMIARRKTREFFRLASDLRNVKGRRREEAYISHMDNDDGSWDADEEFYANYDDDEEIPANAITDGETAKQWGRVFQLLGYCGAVDSKGEGIIHPNEPTQAVFFSISGIRVLELVDNIAPSEPYTDIQIYTKQPMALLARIRRGMPETELIDILDQNPYLIKKIGFSNLPDETKEYVRKHHQTFAEKITEGKIDAVRIEKESSRIPEPFWMSIVNNVVAKWGKTLLSQNMAFNNCRKVSMSLVAALQNAGFNAELVRLSESGKYYPLAHQEWLKMGSMFWAVHYVVKIDNMCVDLTRRQFDPKSTVPWVAPWSEIEKEWADRRVINSR